MTRGAHRDDALPDVALPDLEERARDGRCEHCGLDAGGAHFCCYGCELAHQLATESDEERHATAGLLTLSLLLAMIVMMMSLFLYAEDIYEATSDPVFAWLRGAYRWASGALATPVVLMLGIPLGRRAWRRLMERAITMELLIVVGAVAAWIASMGAVIGGGTAVYFDSAVAALVLATFGRYLEAKARTRASQLVGHLLEPSATPVIVEGRRVAPAAIAAGTTFRVAAEQVVPVDARVVTPVEVSLAVLNGESAPVALAAGDEVPAGATPLSGELVAVALRPASDSTLETLARLAKGLRQGRTEVQRWADQLATWLTPLVTAIALAALVYWGQRSSWPVGIETALAVVLVACPCTYGVITPLIMWLTLRKALAGGVCVRDARVVEAMAEASVVAFDKTGTLTQPMHRVRMHRHGAHDEAVAVWVAALEDGRRHPVARALARWASEHGGATTAGLIERRSCDGQGVVARDERGRAIALGSPRLMESLSVDVAAGALDRAAYLAIDGELVASFEVDEALRPEAHEVMEEVAEAGLRRIILSGDRQARVARLGATLGVEARGELTASDKVAALRELGGRAVIVGDGVNDAPASAAAAIGVAVAGASGLNRGMADVTLLREDLRLVPWVLGLSRRASHLARRTLAAATAYNVLFVALAASGVLRPVWAGLSMLAASLLALGSALRMAAYPVAGAGRGSGAAAGASASPGSFEVTA